MGWQIAQLVIIALISLTAFIVVTIIAWPAWVTMYQVFRAWRKGRHFRRRYRRDPEFRRQVDCIGKYEAHVGSFYYAKAYKNSLAAAAPKEGDAMSEVHRRHYDKAVTDFSKLRDIASAYLKDLPDEDIPIIAEYINGEWFDGHAPQDEIMAFLKRERELMGQSPALVTEHLERALKSFAKHHPLYSEQNRAPDDGQ